MILRIDDTLYSNHSDCCAMIMRYTFVIFNNPSPAFFIHTCMPFYIMLCLHTYTCMSYLHTYTHAFIRYIFVIFNNPNPRFSFTHTHMHVTLHTYTCIRKIFSKSIFIWRSVDVFKWHRRHLSLDVVYSTYFYILNFVAPFSMPLWLLFSPDHSLLKISDTNFEII